MDNVKNAFTAYLVRALKNTTINYRDKKKYVNDKIRTFDPAWMDALADAGSRAEENDCQMENPENVSNAVGEEWKQSVEDERLLLLFRRLTDREQDIVWKRLFLKQSFADIGNAYHLTEDQAKHVYYYAISKMRRNSDGV